ncbi:hypothetical protein [Ralstonia pseudosolanacearum]|uniref:hypothetical protein n=1 Tax=Ralstonia pseudosolanacearum TaxID=1310165 RepID=UPI003D16C19B
MGDLRPMRKNKCRADSRGAIPAGGKRPDGQPTDAAIPAMPAASLAQPDGTQTRMRALCYASMLQRTLNSSSEKRHPDDC